MMFDRDDEERGFFWHGPAPPMRVPARGWGKNPYEHLYALDGRGSCDSACEACAWNRARALKQREDFGSPTPPIIPTADDLKFLAELKVRWEGDKRA